MSNFNLFDHFPAATVQEQIEDKFKNLLERYPDHVLDSEPVEIFYHEDVTTDHGTPVKFRAQQRYFLRPKTEEELAAEKGDRTDKILRKNMAQGVCISCGDYIMGDQPMESTIHGLYHGRPWPCLDGRD